MRTAAPFPLAHATAGERPEPLTIVLSGDVPELDSITNGMTAYRMQAGYFRAEAIRFVTLLGEHAPGGFLHAVLVALLDQRANLLRVPELEPPVLVWHACHVSRKNERMAVGEVCARCGARVVGRSAV